ncbi:MAG: hypothetical protein ACO1SV_19305 [Fimbriimonas sp.]
MHPNPHDLNAAVRDAQTDAPSAEALARAVAVMRKPSPRPSYVTVPRIAMVAVVAGAFMLLPLVTPRSAGAWAQVAEATARQERFHERMFVETEGKRFSGMERWVDGDRHVVLFGRGKMRAQMGSDGKRSFSYFSGSSYAVVDAPRARPQGEYISGMGEVPSFNIDEMLRDKKVRPVGEPKREKTDDGERLVYTVEYLSADGKEEVTSKGRFYVAEGDSRVRRWELVSNDGKVSFGGELEYPDRIPREVFAFNPPAGVRVYDLVKGKAELRKVVEKGFGTKSVGGHSVTLRAIMGGPNRDLTILWTGAPPNGDLKHPVKVQGLPVLRTGGLSILTTKVYEYVPAAEKLDYLPTHLAGMIVASKRALPRKVTVTVPVFAPDPSRPVFDFEGRRTGYRSRYVGAVTYKDVPVLDVGRFYDYLDYLNLREPNRYEALVRDYKKKPKPIP